MTQYNIYFGTIGKTLGCKYQFTREFRNEQEAISIAKNAASSMFYKYEGKYGIPSYSTISKESEITGVDIETLYQEHIRDMMRYYVIPTDLDTIRSNKLRF